MKEIAIVGAVRTAVGRFGGTLTHKSQCELGAIVLEEIVKRTNIDPSDVDEIVMGCAFQSGYNLNCGRQAALRAGFPVEVPGYTVDRQCASGLEAISQAVMRIQTNNAETVFAGGAENMSNLPFYIMDVRWSGLKLGNAILRDWFIDAVETVSGPRDRFGKINMGLTAENIAEKLKMSRTNMPPKATRRLSRLLTRANSKMRLFLPHYLNQKAHLSYSILTSHHAEIHPSNRYLSCHPSSEKEARSRLGILVR